MQVVIPMEEPERATEDFEVLTNPLHGSGNANIKSSIEMTSIARKDRGAVRVPPSTSGRPLPRNDGAHWW